MPSAEAHLAVFTLERLFTFVDQQVSLELVRIAKFRRTEFAGIRTFSGVDPQMASKIGYLYKLPVAVATMIWLLSCVQSHVSLQVVVPRKSAKRIETLQKLQEIDGYSKLFVTFNENCKT